MVEWKRIFDYQCPRLPPRRGGIHKCLNIYNRLEKYQIVFRTNGTSYREHFNTFGHYRGTIDSAGRYNGSFWDARPCRWPRLSWAVTRIRHERAGQLPLFDTNRHLVRAKQ